MAKTENAVAKAQQRTPSNGQNVHVQQMTDALKNAEIGVEITGEYHKFEVGDVLRAYIMGNKTMQSMSDANETIKAIRILDEDGNISITAEVVLRSTFGDIAEKVENGDLKPVPVEIHCIGEDGPKGRSYKKFRAFTLQAAIS